MRASLVVVLFVGACSSSALVPCAEQATCDPLGAVCANGFCHKPGDPELDLGVEDLVMPEPDLAEPCIDDTSCTSATSPICDLTTRLCRACAGDDCATRTATPLCQTSGPLAGACVQCLSESDCAAAHQVCSSAGTCVACTASPQCGSGVCEAGICVEEASITYVDNNQAPCTGADGTRAKAYCTLAAALASMSASDRYVYVVGSTTPYVGMSTYNTAPTQLSIVGPGAHASPPARLSPVGSGPSFAATDSSGPAVVVVEGLDLYGNPVGSSLEWIVAIDGTVDLTLRDTYVHGSKGTALKRFGGSVTLDHVEIANIGLAITEYLTSLHAGAAFNVRRSYVHDNGGGFSLANATPVVFENNLIVRNGDATRSSDILYFANTSNVAFRFNTVSDNVIGNLGTITRCQGATMTLSSSIYAGNHFVGGSQFAGCTLDNVVTGTDPAAGAIQLSPVFASATDFHLVPNDPANLACCIDKASGGPAVDLDGNARPKGAAWDIGAYEVQ